MPNDGNRLSHCPFLGPCHQLARSELQSAACDPRASNAVVVERGPRACACALGCGTRGGHGGSPPICPVGALRTTAAPVLTSPFVRSGSRGAGVAKECYLVDPASSHLLVSKIKPCMCKDELIQTVKLRMAH